MPKGFRKAWSGKNRFLADYGKESAEELSRWRKQKSEAETAREIEGERKGLWSMIGTGIAYLFGAGPSSPAIGSAVGNIAKGVGTWKGDPIESYKMDTSDVGKWNKSKDLAYLEDLNREFETYDTAEFWTGMQDIGKSALFAYTMGGTEQGFSPAADVSGIGVSSSFGKGPGMTATSAGSTFGEGPGMGFQKYMSSLTPSAPDVTSIEPFTPWGERSNTDQLVQLLMEMAATRR